MIDKCLEQLSLKLQLHLVIIVWEGSKGNYAFFPAVLVFCREPESEEVDPVSQARMTSHRILHELCRAGNAKLHLCMTD